MPRISAAASTARQAAAGRKDADNDGLRRMAAHGGAIDLPRTLVGLVALGGTKAGQSSPGLVGVALSGERSRSTGRRRGGPEIDVAIWDAPRVAKGVVPLAPALPGRLGGSLRARMNPDGPEIGSDLQQVVVTWRRL